MKTTQKHGKTWIILLSVIAFLLAAAGIAYGLALSDLNAPLAATKRTDGIAVRMMQAAITGEPARLTEEEAGALLSHSLMGDKRIQGVRLSINDNQTVNVYVPVVYKQLRFGVSAVILPGWDGAAKQMTAAVQSVHIGRLPVPPRWFLAQVNKQAPKNITVQENTVRISSFLLNKISLGHDNVIYISGLSVSDHVFLVNVTADVNNLKNYLENFLKS